MFTYTISCKLILVMSRDPQLSTCDVNLTTQREKLTISQKKIVLNITFISNETRSYKKTIQKKVLLPVN